MGTTIIKIWTYVFAKLTNPKGEIPLEYPQNRQYLSAVLKFVQVRLLDNVNTSKLLFIESYIV